MVMYGVWDGDKWQCIECGMGINGNVLCWDGERWQCIACGMGIDGNIFRVGWAWVAMYCVWDGDR